jgi:hypothetical protein
MELSDGSPALTLKLNGLSGKGSYGLSAKLRLEPQLAALGFNPREELEDTLDAAVARGAPIISIDE